MKGMSLTLSAVVVAVAVTAAPAVHAQAPAPAQPPAVTPATPPAAEELLEQGRWRLPKSHRYETYTSQGAYVHVETDSVPLRLDRGEMIFDRTAKVWVSHPSTGPNTKYLRASVPAAGADVLSEGRWRLPRSHHYELYNTESASYGKVDVTRVAALADKGHPIFDRTDKVWVFQLGHGPNPRYLAAAPAEVLSDGRWRLPRSHQYEHYNTGDGTYGKIDVTRVAALADKGQPIYDRTDKMWVFQHGHGPNPRYLASTAPVTPPAPAVSTPPASPPAGGAAAIGARVPRDKDDCKKDGWKEFTNPTFTNQGDCVSWVNTHR